jgi:hypothetical protein
VDGVYYTKMMKSYQNTRRHTPEGSSLHSHSGKNIKTLNFKLQQEINEQVHRKIINK